MLCEDCKYGHRCPYMRTDDMLHAVVVEGDEKVGELMGSVRELLTELKGRVKEVFGMSREFDFDVDLAQCEGYEEGVKVRWDNDDLVALHVLVAELYRLAGKCRSEIGVRVPYETFFRVVNVLERCAMCVMSPSVSTGSSN